MRYMRKRKVDMNVTVERERVLSHKVGVSIQELFDGKDFHQVRASLQTLAEEHEKRIIDEDLRVVFEVEYFGYEGDMVLNVCFYRWETDKELEKRKANLEARKERSRLAKERAKESARKKLYKKEADERAEFERLKAKFEKKGVTNV